MRAVDASVPAGVRSVYDQLREAIERRGLPDVLDPLTPTQVRDVPAPDPALEGSPVVNQVGGSVVKITGVAPSCSRQIDGAGFVDKILFVVFPLLRPLILINFIGVFIGTLVGVLRDLRRGAGDFTGG